MPVPSKANVDLKELGGEVSGASSRLVWRSGRSRRFEGGLAERERARGARDSIKPGA